MIEVSSLLLFAASFAVAAAVPGPGQIALLFRAMTRGVLRTLPFASGMILGNGAWLVLALFGLSALAREWSGAFGAAKWLGVAYLLFFAYRLWTDRLLLDGVPPHPERIASAVGFLSGLALSLGNPKAMLFFGALLPSLFDLSAINGRSAVAIVVVCLTIDLAVQSCYLFVAQRARTLLRAPPRIKCFRRTAALVTVCAAMAIALRPRHS